MGQMSFRIADALAVLLLVAAASVPASAVAQSVELLAAYQNFESAKAAGRVADALKFGDEAIKLTAAEHGDPQNLIELLRNMGDYAAAGGVDAAASAYYERALALDETALGPDHPDLVRLLDDLADLRVRQGRLPEAAALLTRVLGIERAAYGARHPNVLDTLHRLRGVYAALNDAAAVARIDADLQAPVAAQDRALTAIPDKTRRYDAAPGFATVRVFYGTNRAASGDSTPALYYGGGRGELQYGYCDVTIPASHKSAELETEPGWAEFTIGSDETSLRKRYVLLDKLVPLDKAAFAAALRDQVRNARSKDVFIFVHGFNNTFEDAARRTAQLAYDLDFDGTPMMYSWPSQGSMTAYTVDEAAVNVSGRKMADFLDTIITQSGAERIHLVAHSMGNRALIEALQTYLARRAPAERQHLFGQILFAAPDVDRDYFKDAIDELRPAAERVTLYASDNDYALRSSQILHGAPRAGSAGDSIVRLPGIDTIDMSSVPADTLGHAYFATNAGAIYDIFRLFWRGDPPPLRCGMVDRGQGAATVWLFNADLCKGDDMLEAGLLVKRFGDLARPRVLANLETVKDAEQRQEWELILKRLDGLLAPARSALPAPASSSGAVK